MRFLHIIFFLILSYSHAASRPYLVCLGKEEVTIHKKKIGGAYYRLNQEMISSLLQVNETIQVNKKKLSKLCDSRFVSIDILEKILFAKTPFFYTNTNIKDVKQKSIDIFSLKELKSRSFTVFLNFLTRLQSNFKDPKCLIKKVPEIASFYDNTQFLLKEQGVDKTLQIIKNSKSFFKNLRELISQRKCN